MTDHDKQQLQLAMEGGLIPVLEQLAAMQLSFIDAIQKAVDYVNGHGGRAQVFEDERGTFHELALFGVRVICYQRDESPFLYFERLKGAL